MKPYVKFVKIFDKILVKIKKYGKTVSKFHVRKYIVRSVKIWRNCEKIRRKMTEMLEKGTVKNFWSKIYWKIKKIHWNFEQHFYRTKIHWSFEQDFEETSRKIV